MSNFEIYSHDRSDPESDMFFICTCVSKESAKYIINALEYRDTGGNPDCIGMYEYIIKEVMI